MRHLKMTLEYDGTGFVGWQTQANGRSVQEEIRKVLEQVTQESVNLIGAGRTDAGVHARGQVAAFRTGCTIGCGSLLGALNGLLPEDICVRSVEEAPEGFHPRYDARQRFYRYVLSLSPSAIHRRFQWYVKYDLNAQLMQSVAAEVTGDHDFESFCKAAAEVHHYRCTVVHSAWHQEGERLVYEVRANRFLHGMVRALVGTMVDMGRGYLPPDAFARILEARDRRKAGMAAPPHGLFLEEVSYE
jgi:tRNA pseudouridine38-40 synthase